MESFGILESLAASKKPRFPFLCTHRFVPRLVFAAIYSTFAGSSQIKGTPVWNGSLGVLWPLLGGSWGSFGRPLGSLGTPLGYLGGPLRVLWGVLGLPSGALGCTLGVPWDLLGVLRASERQNGTKLEPKWTHWSQNEAKIELKSISIDFQWIFN